VAGAKPGQSLDKAVSPLKDRGAPTWTKALTALATSAACWSSSAHCPNRTPGATSSAVASSQPIRLRTGNVTTCVAFSECVCVCANVSVSSLVAPQPTHSPGPKTPTTHEHQTGAPAPTSQGAAVVDFQ